jgi:hypothetical protein
LKDDVGLNATVLGTTGDAKLVRLSVDGEGGASLEGFAVYTSNSRGWHLTGFLGQGGHPNDFTVQRFERVGVAYRFDLATTTDSATSTNGVMSVPALERQIMSSFCTGSGWRCTNVVSHCEQIVNGQTVTVYNGTLTVHDRTISIKGNGTQPSCASDVEENF